MALSFLYDNGPTGPSYISGFDGDVEAITYTTADSAIIEFTVLPAPPIGSISVGDIVVISKSTDPSDFLVGVITNTSLPTAYDAAIKIGFNPDVYSLSGTTGYSISIESEARHSTRVINFADTYTITADVEAAVFSNKLIKYSNKVTYNLSIDNLRRSFFGAAKDILSADSLYIVDDCEGSNGYAYKIAITEDSFDLLNNKFRKRINFRIASV